MSPLPLCKSSSSNLNLSEAQNYIATLEEQIIYYEKTIETLNRQLLAAKQESQCGRNFVRKSNRRYSELYRKSMKRRKSDAKTFNIHETEGASTSNNYLAISGRNRSTSSDNQNSNVELIVRLGRTSISP